MINMGAFLMNSFSAANRAVIATFVFLCISADAHAKTVSLHAVLKLVGRQVSREELRGSGIVTATVETDSGLFKYQVNFEHLANPATAADFHGPATPGRDAKVQIRIMVPTIVTPLGGTALLHPDQVRDLVEGRWYFDIHTTRNPEGELRGQLVPGR